MDENKSESAVEEIDGERSEEEVAWDKEFKGDKDSSFASAIGDMVKLVVKIPVAIVQMPLSIIPEETARHTRAAFRETFLAFRSLLGAIGDGIENILAEPEKAGPDGTWGTGLAARPKADTAPSAGRMKRIQLSDEDATESYSDSTANTSDEAEEEDTGEGRGLRADIEY